MQGKRSLGLRAGGLHLLVSLAVGCVALGLILLRWYPGELATAQGVWKILVVLFFVHLAVGPLITAFTYAPDKRGLPFDLAVIAALQTAALLYGLKVIEGGRPAYVVFSVDRFEVVAPTELVRGGSQPFYREIAQSLGGPQWVAAVLPADPARRSAILLSAISGQGDLAQMPEFFVPIEDQQASIARASRPLTELIELNQLSEDQAHRAFAAFALPRERLRYLPLQGRVADAAVIVEGASGRVLGIRMLEPQFPVPASGMSPALSSAREGPDTRPCLEQSPWMTSASASTGRLRPSVGQNMPFTPDSAGCIRPEGIASAKFCKKESRSPPAPSRRDLPAIAGSWPHGGGDGYSYGRRDRIRVPAFRGIGESADATDV